MKKKSLTGMFLLSAAILFFTVYGCRSISADKVKGAILNEENCLKACDEKADKAFAEFSDCQKSCQENYRNALERCEHVAPANKMECERRAFEDFEKELDKCLADYKVKREEVKKCRKDCHDRFPLEMGIK